MFVAIMKYGCIPFEFLLSHRYAAIRLLLTTPSRHSRDDGPAAAPASHNVAFVAEAVRDQSQQYYPEPGDVRILQRHERQGEHHVPHGDHDRRLQIARVIFGGDWIRSKSGVHGGTGARMCPVLLARRGKIFWS